MLALIKKGVDYVFAQNSLHTVDDTTPVDLVDGLLSNWFLTRQLGTRSVISARIYFARQKNTAINSGVYFSTDNVNKFYPTEALSYSASAMAFDSFNNEYYLDIDLMAEQEGSTYNIGSGSLLYFTNFDPYFLRAEINFLKSASILSESNSKFISRASTAISTRNLINSPSIDYNLRAAFNYIPRLVSIGMGDQEMIRDQIKVVFDPGTPVQITSAHYNGSVITVVLPNHGYNNGQEIQMTGITPTGYNGVYPISVLSSTTFTYTPLVSYGEVASTANAMVCTATTPTLIHTGGVVDVYCTEKLANAVVQLTLDEFGKSELTGPIFSAFRSAVSGGDEEDTLNVNDTSPYIISHKNTQSKNIYSISVDEFNVTLTLPHHGYTVGRYFKIIDAVPSSYNGTWLITGILNKDQFTYKILDTPTSGFVSGRSLFVIPYEDFGFSQKQLLTLDFGVPNANKTVSMQLGYFQNLDSIQTYLDSPANRVVCGDYLARGFNFYNLTVGITSYTETYPDSAVAASIVESYLSGLGIGEMLVISDMVAQLRLGGIINIQNPPSVTYKKYTRDLNSVEHGLVTNILDPNDRTNVFLLEALTTSIQTLPTNTLIIN